MVNGFVETRGKGPTSKPITKIDLPAHEPAIIIHYKSNCNMGRNVFVDEGTITYEVSIWEIALAQLKLTKIKFDLGGTSAMFLNNQTDNFKLDPPFKVWTYQNGVIPFDHILTFFRTGEFSLSGSYKTNTVQLGNFPKSCEQRADGKIRCVFSFDDVKNVKVSAGGVEFVFSNEKITYIIEKDHTDSFVAFLAFLRALYGDKILD
jgi:hypothetical protein